MLSLDWWTAGRGWAGVAQWPNPAISVWAIAVVILWAGGADALGGAALVRGIAVGALLVWAVDEVVRGTSPFRRLMGAVVLVFQAVMLIAG